MGYILLAIFLYFVYRFTVGFVLPVMRTTAEVKRKVREMQSQQSGHSATDNSNQNIPHGPADTGEYIEFEEVKD